MMIQRTKSESDKKPEYEPKFTNYTTLKASRAKAYLASHEDVPYRKPPPLKEEKGKKDTNKYCRFHDDYGHETNKCRHLKDRIPPTIEEVEEIQGSQERRKGRP